MKTGGLILSTVLLIGGLLRVTGSVASRQSPEPVRQAGVAGKNKSRTADKYTEELRAQIEDFYGVREESRAKITDLAALFSLLQASGQLQRDRLPLVVAALPDPAHTRLGLFFDRGLEAIQQAAQVKGYAFDRAILPWGRTRSSDAADAAPGHEGSDKESAREEYPGLLIFRTPKENSQQTSRPPLFVWVVGETPTSGLNKPQFQNAVKMISQIRGDTLPSRTENTQPFLILGPTFSGSFDSLSQLLVQGSPNPTATFVYSGTVTALGSMNWFEQNLGASGHFASFQENDEYVRDRFLKFACRRGYQPGEVAILSEDGTVYGDDDNSTDAQDRRPPRIGSKENPCVNATNSSFDGNTPVRLHFPREISYFRAAYQKEATSQQATQQTPAGVSTLPLDSDNTAQTDDSVAPYATAQTPVSQEAVMLGIISELQKHHIKFTLLLASDPMDQLFLARYLRTAYPQGRVVVTTPDLLFTTEEDVTLRGVLGLNAYSLSPGLGDKLCRQEPASGVHEDRLFVSSSSIGTFNAMIGLLSVNDAELHGWQPPSAIDRDHATPSIGSQGEIPPGPYAEYGSPQLSSSGQDFCQGRPLLWLTMLGRDGFWPVAGLVDQNVHATDGHVPVTFLRKDAGQLSSLKTAISFRPDTDTVSNPQTPLAWNLAFWLCLLLLFVHAILSCSGTILADSEAKAQFARTFDWRDSAIIGLGAVFLASAFVLVMCTRSPRIEWDFRTIAMWSPLPLFIIATIWDLGELRGQPWVAAVFTFVVVGVTRYQIVHLWSRGERFLQFASGVSPVLPVLLLLAAGYWWMWQGLRGVTLVDLRRPRLPSRESLSTLSVIAYRISDTEGEELRRVAHPFLFAWQIFFPLATMALIAFTVLDREHPIQTLEGRAYDWGYSLLLGCVIAGFLGSLLKLIWTWLKCRQILSGLNRLPLREAFSRLKGLSWHSFWNPGGSSLRETYKLISFALESLGHLDHILATQEKNMRIPSGIRHQVRGQIEETLKARETVRLAYGKAIPAEEPRHRLRSRGLIQALKNHFETWPQKRTREMHGTPILLLAVEHLQKQMAATAATLMATVLMFRWSEEDTPILSSDERIENSKLPLSRALAEEFVALVYVNFLVTVLLRMRTLVATAAGIYVLLVLSISVYPFEPHPALLTLAVVLLFVMFGAVGYVYAEMHRDVILSRLTSTEPGELGVDFWIKFGSAAVIPVFSLLASQFPSINQFLFSWLQPILEAVR